MIVVERDVEKLIKDEIKFVEQNGKPLKGKTEYIKFLRGEHVTYKEMVYAQCYACQNYYIDGKSDCRSILCPMYKYFPYRDLKSEDSD